MAILAYISGVAVKIFVFILFLLPWSLAANIVVSYQSRGFLARVIEFEKGKMMLRVEMDLSIYAQKSKARKRAQKLALGVLEQIRNTQNMQIVGQKHFFVPGFEIYETYLLLPKESQ